MIRTLTFVVIVSMAAGMPAVAQSPLESLEQTTDREIRKLQREQEEVVRTVVRLTLTSKPDRKALTQAVVRLTRIDSQLAVLLYHRHGNDLTAKVVRENLALYDLGNVQTPDEAVDRAAATVVARVFRIERVFEFKRLQGRPLRIRARGRSDQAAVARTREGERP